MGVKGPPGIGKSRITREATDIAARHGVDVVSTFCESHSSEIPFNAVAGLLRALFGLDGLSGAQAKAKTRAALPDASSTDLVLLDDLLGIGDADSTEGVIDPDARRRRLGNLLDAALLGRCEPTLYIIEDAHSVDAASESMLTDFISVAPRANALVLITYRPEIPGTASSRRCADTFACPAGLFARIDAHRGTVGLRSVRRPSGGAGR